VAWRVNDVHAMRHARESLDQPLLPFLRPETRHRSRRDGDAALAFLLHPVGHRVAVIHIADAVDETGVKQDALGGRRLPASMCAAMPMLRVRSSV